MLGPKTLPMEERRCTRRLEYIPDRQLVRLAVAPGMGGRKQKYRYGAVVASQPCAEEVQATK